MILKPEKTIARLESGTPTTVAAIGDSLTTGWMAPKGYIDFLREWFREQYAESPVTIIASGIPGDTADFGRIRVDRSILHQSPDCVLIQYALNDAACGFTPEQFKDNMQAIIDRVRAAGDADIILVTAAHVGNLGERHFAEEYYEIIEHLGKSKGLPVAKVHEHWKKAIAAGVNYESLVQFDLVHPTVAGYRVMAEAIIELFS